MTIGIQERIRTRLETIIIPETKKVAGLLGTIIRVAENNLTLAEQEFRESAFIPFWDAVEKATKDLATYHACIQALIENSQIYRRESSKLIIPLSEPFTLGITTIPDPAHALSRLSTIVKTAQSNFQFALIYEQRKTNQLLVSGFRTLAETLRELGPRIESSLGEFQNEFRLWMGEIVQMQSEANNQLLDLNSKFSEH